MANFILNFDSNASAYLGVVDNKYFRFTTDPVVQARFYNSINDYQTNIQNTIDISMQYEISISGNVYTINSSTNNLIVGYVITVNNDNTISVQTNTPAPSTDIDIGMGSAYYEEDLTTNVKKYFAESFKFDGSQFEMDGDRIVGLKQSFIDTLATDLTNIVNTSISTATLTADVATINQTLTALGINTDLLKTKDLRLVDAQGHEHKIHLGN
jgi:hypothetical protein